mgnify:FL=1
MSVIGKVNFKMKGKLCILICIILICFLTGCNSNNWKIEINNDYEITQEEKDQLKEQAFKLVRSRTYCAFCNVVDEYAEDNFYYMEVDSCKGEKFKIKFDLSEKDENGNYRMYSYE